MHTLNISLVENVDNEMYVIIKTLNFTDQFN